MHLNTFDYFNCDDFSSHLAKTHQFTTDYNMVTCQSANQLKTPAKVSWFFKMVSQFGSLGDTIMGKTADLTVVQKTIIDTLHKEGKTQTFITKEAVHRVLYPSMLTESWVEGKRCTTNRENRSLMRIVKQNRFKNLGELHKEWTEAGVKASRAPHTDVSRNLATVVFRGVLPGLREEELDCYPVVQSPLFRWEQVLYFICKPRSWSLEEGWRSS